MQKDDAHAVLEASYAIDRQDFGMKQSTHPLIQMDAGIWCKTYVDAHSLRVRRYSQ